MRILIAHNRYRPEAPSGENVVVDQEAEALQEAGHEVLLFQRHSGEIASWSRLRRAGLPARVLWSSGARRDLAAELVRFAPDVVHVHNTFPLLTPSILYACRDAGVPVVATLHNYKLACASGELFRDGAVCHDCLPGSRRPALEHGCYRGSRVATVPVVIGARLHAEAWRTLVSAYVFISAAQRAILAPLGLPSERSFVKHNFVPGREASGALPGPKEHAVAFVGRLDPAKGAGFLIEAWTAFRVRRPKSNLRLTIAGAGPMAGDVTRWAAADPSVTMLGQVSREAAAGILARSRAVLMPSQWEETFGMVAVEAMAQGTAPVAAAHGSFPELITPGRDGVLFPPDDRDALVDVLEEIDDHPGRWDELGRQAAEAYPRRFSREASIERLLEIYRFAIDTPTGQFGSIAGIPGHSARSTS
jgi:glycosyltransferase involved in cell wall biosynthesis